MQDELASMFHQTMTLSQPQVQKQPVEEARPPPTPTANFSISQHYHHSAHQVPQIQTSDEPQFETPLMDSHIEAMLSQHSIDASELSPPQITLFRNASSEQRNRLIELWSISSPQNKSSLEGTSIENEEQLARMRYQGLATERNLSDTNAAQDNQEDIRAAEPYVKNGYEMLAERDYNIQAQAPSAEKPIYQPLGTAVGTPHRLDPSFSSREWWRDFVGDQPMEYQYGMFEHMWHHQPQQSSNVQEDEDML